MKSGVALVTAGFLLTLSHAVVAKADIVYVTCTGTVTAGTDPGGVFGQSGSLNGRPYEVFYVFDTGSYHDNQPTHNFIFGGTAFGNPSPLVGTAVLTVGGVSIEIAGNKVGEIVGTNNGPNAFSEQLHRAYDANGSLLENSIFTFSGGLPATITTPFVYQVTSSDGGNSDFSAFVTGPSGCSRPSRTHNVADNDRGFGWGVLLLSSERQSARRERRRLCARAARSF